VGKTISISDLKTAHLPGIAHYRAFLNFSMAFTVLLPKITPLGSLLLGTMMTNLSPLLFMVCLMPPTEN